MRQVRLIVPISFQTTFQLENCLPIAVVFPSYRSGTVSSQSASPPRAIRSLPCSSAMIQVGEAVGVERLEI
jgi:hypothetical protein